MLTVRSILRLSRCKGYDQFDLVLQQALANARQINTYLNTPLEST